MKCFTLLSLIFFSSIAFTSENLQFTYFGNEGRNRIYLSCYYAQNATIELLEKIEAQEIEVSCFGGLDFGFYTPVSIQAEYLLPEKSAMMTIESDFNSNCYFDTRLISELAIQSDKIEILKGRSHCFRSDSFYSFNLQIN